MISLQFDSLHELFWMSGNATMPHGPYVWGSYAIALVALIYLVWSPLARRKRFFREMRAAQRRQPAGASAAKEPSNTVSEQ